MGIAKNAYKITLMVEAYIREIGTIEQVAKAMGYKGTDRVQELIDTQSWQPKHVDKLIRAHIINHERRKEARKLVDRHKEITTQVSIFLKHVGSVKKLATFLGMASPTTLYNRLKAHNWTEQEKALLTNKRILDDTF
jgi:hypothetical protein